MRYSTLGQETSQSLWQSLTGKVEQFRQQYQLWNATGRNELPALTQQLTDAKVRLSVAAQRAYQAGDIEGMRAYNARVTEAEAVQRELSDLSGTASRWQSSWDVLFSWLQTASWDVQYSGIGALPLVAPLAVATAVAAVGALAWVVNTWQQLRARTVTIKDLADRVAAGQLTAEQARTLAQAAQPVGLFAGFGLGGMMPLLIIGGLALFLWRR